MKIINEKKLRNNMENRILSDIESGIVGGVAVSVMQDGKVVYKGCFGDEKTGTKVSDKTLFRLASMTKPITAAAALLLWDQGKLDLDMPISRVLPEFGDMNVGRMVDGKAQVAFASKTPVTVRHLLSHSSGLGSGTIGEYFDTILPGPQRKNLEQAVRFYAGTMLSFEPFTNQEYSGLFAFDVIARIIEIITGEAYDVFLKKEIFEPLKMSDTTFAPDEEQWHRIIPMHTYEDGVGKLTGFPENSVFEGIPTTCFAGGAGLASTLEDYTKFAEMLLHRGYADNHRLISEKAILEMAKPQLPPSIQSGNEMWGLGVRVVVKDDYPYMLPCGSFGWSGAYGTHFWVDPENRITAVYLKNSRYDGGAGAKTACNFEMDVYTAI